MYKQKTEKRTVDYSQRLGVKKVAAKSCTNTSAISFGHFKNNLGNYRARDFENGYYKAPKLFSIKPKLMHQTINNNLYLTLTFTCNTEFFKAC
jgi:hypothetical protein